MSESSSSSSSSSKHLLLHGLHAAPSISPSEPPPSPPPSAAAATPDSGMKAALSYFSSFGGVCSYGSYGIGFWSVEGRCIGFGKHLLSTSISSYHARWIQLGMSRLGLQLFEPTRSRTPGQLGWAPMMCLWASCSRTSSFLAAGKQHSTIAVRMSSGGKFPQRRKQVLMVN